MLLILAFADLMFFMKIISFVWLSWQLIFSKMEKIEKRNLLPRNCIYFDKTFIEMILEKSCFGHIFLAHYSIVLVAMETIMRKKEQENT